jgi:hypothetical protein
MLHRVCEKSSCVSDEGFMGLLLFIEQMYRVLQYLFWDFFLEPYLSAELQLISREQGGKFELFVSQSEWQAALVANPSISFSWRKWVH